MVIFDDSIKLVQLHLVQDKYRVYGKFFYFTLTFLQYSSSQLETICKFHFDKMQGSLHNHVNLNIMGIQIVIKEILILNIHFA